MKKIKQILRHILVDIVEFLFTISMVMVMFVCIFTTFLISIYTEINTQIDEDIDLSFGEHVVFILSPIIIIPLIITMITVSIYLLKSINKLRFKISCKIESFSLFRSRRKLNFFKALYFILKSKKVRSFLPKYLKQQIQSENKFFRKYRDKSIYEINPALLLSCKLGDLDEVKYLLISSELKENANINFEDPLSSYRSSNPLSNACSQGRLDIIKYLLFSKELKENIDIQKFADSALDSALDAAIDYDHLDTLKYLIFELKIEKTPYVKNFIENASSDEFSYIDNLFKIRDLNDKLNSDMNINISEKNKVIKV